ncbi:MAG: hypothetical protein M3R04_09425, partial [bacterium]|nr:hypothetical protein [bacterium]
MILREDGLRSVSAFPQLVAFLRDELDWPIDARDDFEDLLFEYEPSELGIEPGTAAKIREIKQLRPLADGQPWGIFFVKFEPKQLPVVALRRILSKLALTRRGNAPDASRAAWQADDLLFISSYGEQDSRNISFAHFVPIPESGSLPTLKVLGWDSADTVLKVEHVAREVRKLQWPADPTAAQQWREQWASAFTLRPKEVIATSKALALRLAELARRIRDAASAALAIETETGPLTKLHAAFKAALIHDLKPEDFADMYAQTIAYGLLAARVSRPMGIVAENLHDMVPITNPFLKEMLSAFLTAGGRQGQLDFDELGVNDVVELLNDEERVKMDAVLRDFGNRNPDEDPVIRFYEDFLREYDKKLKAKRGVFYTPRPVVSYIVRSVNELLQSEFGLADGLADTATWGEMAARLPDLKIPAGTSPDSHFVCILDPATGTATFLVEVIEVIHQTMTTNWTAQGLSAPTSAAKRG